MLCKCGKGNTILVYYMPLGSSERQFYLACSRCDFVDKWPNYSRSSPPVPKE